MWDEKHLRLGIEAAGIALWSWNVDSDRLTMDEIGYELWVLPKGDGVTFEALSANIHPADRDRVRAAFSATRGIVGPYEIDFRIMVNDEVRWISARGRGDDEGIEGRVMYGVFLDVTGRKQAEEANELLAGEMSHRVKNLIAIAGALTTMTSRSAETKEDMARELTHRLTALGRAHDLVRPVPGQIETAALLGDLLSVLLTPYDDLGAFSGRIRISVPRMGIAEPPPPIWRSFFTSLRRTRSNTAPCRRRPACSMSPVWSMTVSRPSSGRSAAARPCSRRPQGRDSAAGCCRGS